MEAYGKRAPAKLVTEERLKELADGAVNRVQYIVPRLRTREAWRSAIVTALRTLAVEVRSNMEKIQ